MYNWPFLGKVHLNFNTSYAFCNYADYAEVVLILFAEVCRVMPR